MKRRDVFSVLGLSVKATPSEIRDQYKKLAREKHPDRNGNTKEATALFQQLQEAYNAAMEMKDQPSTLSKAAADQLFNDFVRPRSRNSAGSAAAASTPQRKSFPKTSFPDFNNDVTVFDIRHTARIEPVILAKDAKVVVSFVRRTLCQSCFFETPPSVCSSCVGHKFTGRKTPCFKCKRTGFVNECETCSKSCFIEKTETFEVLCSQLESTTVLYDGKGHEYWHNGTLQCGKAIVTFEVQGLFGWTKRTHYSPVSTLEGIYERAISVKLVDILSRKPIEVENIFGKMLRISNIEVMASQTIELSTIEFGKQGKLKCMLTIVAEFPKWGEYDVKAVEEALSVNKSET
jgi:DnaJ-class molecular chaperone